MQPTMSPAEEFEVRYVQPRPGTTLIVGSQVYGSKFDRRMLFPKAIGVDMLAGQGVDRVLDLEEPLPTNLGRFAHIECLSVLEHSRRPWLLAANVERLLKPHGTLFLSVPFVWRFHGYPSDYWRFTAEGVKALFPSIEWTRLMYASDRLRPDPYLKAEDTVDGHPLLPKCEVMGFGVRK